MELSKDFEEESPPEIAEVTALIRSILPPLAPLDTGPDLPKREEINAKNRHLGDSSTD